MERHPMFMDQDIYIVKISMLPKAKGITPPNVKLYYKIEVAQSCLTLCDPIACQVLASMGFSRQEYWSGLPFPPPGDLSNSGIEPASLLSPTMVDGFFTTRATWEAPELNINCT